MKTPEVCEHAPHTLLQLLRPAASEHQLGVAGITHSLLIPARTLVTVAGILSWYANLCPGTLNHRPSL